MAYNWAALMRGIWSRKRPQMQAGSEGQADLAARQTAYGDMVVQSLFQKQHALADEESSFCLSGTIGTGIATIAVLTTLADTSPFIIAKNIGTPGNDPSAFLDLLKLICTAAGTAGTSLRYGVKVGPSRADPTGMDAAFNPTLGAPTGVPQNTNAKSNVQSILRVYAGALVAPAALGGTRQLGGGLLKSAIPVANDQYLLSFGGVDPAAPATQVDRNDHHPAISIPPGYSAFIHIWLPSQSAASSYEVQLSHHER